jgi:hypothetical protein
LREESAEEVRELQSTFRRRTAGLGLVDALIAMTLLLIGLLSTLNVVLSGTTLGRVDGETRVVTQVASQLLDEIRATPYADMVATYHDATFTLEDRAYGVGQGHAHVSVVEDVTGFTRWPVYLVTIRVTIDGVNGTRTTEIASCVSNTKPEGAPF